MICQRQRQSETVSLMATLNGGGISCTVEYSDSISAFSKIIWYAARWCFSIFVWRKLTNCNTGKAERFNPRVPQQTGCHVKDSGIVVTIFCKFLSKARNEYEIFFGSSYGCDSEDSLFWYLMLHNFVSSNQCFGVTRCFQVKNKYSDDRASFS